MAGIANVPQAGGRGGVHGIANIIGSSKTKKERVSRLTAVTKGNQNDENDKAGRLRQGSAFQNLGIGNTGPGFFSDTKRIRILNAKNNRSRKTKTRLGE